MTLQPLRALSIAFLLAAAGCSFKADPDADRFSCSSDADCGEGQVCKTQRASGKGICFAASSCTEEICDGRDNDCDGEIDEEVVGVGAACETGEEGICKFGLVSCRGGELVCTGGAPAVMELCNGLDDDCDGQIDEDFDLTSDPQNCGACGDACAAGAQCVGSACVESDCGNGLDDDGDGQTDCADADCDALPCGAGCLCGTSASVETDCADGIDNDGDGASDCDDSDCRGLACDADDPTLNCGEDDSNEPACVAREAICDDTLDNDRDGAINCDDPDCRGRTCGEGLNCGGAGGRSCVQIEADCLNGIDDDRDGNADCADSDCAGLTCDVKDGTVNCGRDSAGDLACVARESECGNGIDDDGDGRADCEDSDCGVQCGTGCLCSGAQKTEAACDDGTDNDGDGQSDCEDADCDGSSCTLAGGGSGLCSQGSCE